MTLIQSPCPYLTRDDESHTYLDAQGRQIPISVTGVLSSSDSPYKIAALERTRHIWAPRGNACHAALEAWIKAEGRWAISHGDDALEPYLDWILPLTVWNGWDGLAFTASELLLHYPEDNYAGTFDGSYIDRKGRHVLFDLKSRGRATDGTYSTAAQLGGYLNAAARWGLNFDYAVTIWARPRRFPTLTVYGIPQCLQAWGRAWANYEQNREAPGLRIA